MITAFVIAGGIRDSMVRVFHIRSFEKGISISCMNRGEKSILFRKIFLGIGCLIKSRDSLDAGRYRPMKIKLR